MEHISHDTFVVGINEQREVVFLKGYNYFQQKEEALSDLSWVQGNCNGWWITGFSDWELADTDQTPFKFKLPEATKS